jgi:hypothetical protein
MPGWGAAKSLDLRGSPPSRVLQEIQLGQKRCHDLEFRLSVSPLRNVVPHEAWNSQARRSEQGFCQGRSQKKCGAGTRLNYGPFVLGSHLGFANATSLARMRHLRFFWAERSSLRSQFSSASPRGLLYSTCSGNNLFSSGYLLYCEHTHSWYGFQARLDKLWAKKKAPEPDNLFVSNVSVPRRGRATPPSQTSLSLFAILSLLLFLFLPHSFFYAPPKNFAPQKKLFPKKMFFAPIFFLLPFFFGSLIPRAT